MLSAGWIRTRDLGYLDGDGLLHLTGRARDVIMVNAEVTCYRHLVAGLPPGPQVRAYRSVVGEDGWPGSLVELATKYLQDLRRQQPQGPYHLCGWSFGGVLAFEMAARLVGAGEEVAFLALLESRLRLTRLRLDLTTDEGLLRVFLRDHELDGAGDAASGRPERALAQARLRGIVGAQLSMDEFVEVGTRYGAAFRDNVDLARRYKPSGRVPRALFVEAVERPGWGPRQDHSRRTGRSGWTCSTGSRWPAITSRSFGRRTCGGWRRSWPHLAGSPRTAL